MYSSFYKQCGQRAIFELTTLSVIPISSLSTGYGNGQYDEKVQAFLLFTSGLPVLILAESHRTNCPTFIAVNGIKSSGVCSVCIPSAF